MALTCHLTDTSVTCLTYRMFSVLPVYLCICYPSEFISETCIRSSTQDVSLQLNCRNLSSPNLSYDTVTTFGLIGQTSS
jgi:hypothetical protein